MFPIMSWMLAVCEIIDWALSKAVHRDLKLRMLRLDERAHHLKRHTWRKLRAAAAVSPIMSWM